MKKLYKLKQQVIDNQYKTSEFQKDVFLYYEKNKKTFGLKDLILKLIKDCLFEEIGTKLSWKLEFSSNLAMYEEIILLINEYDSIKSLDIFQKNPNVILLEQIVDTAYSSSLNCHDELHFKILNVWRKTFSHIPTFNSFLSIYK